MRDANAAQDGSGVISRDSSGTLDAMPSFITTGSRIDYACSVALKRNRNIRSESALAEELDCPLGSLRAMRREAYSAPRSADGLAVMRRIALLSDLSFEWLRFGDSRQPVPLSEDEAQGLKRELGVVPQAAGAQQATPAAPGFAQLNPAYWMICYGIVVSHPRVIQQGWNADDVFPCVNALYNAMGGKTDPVFANQFIADYKHF